MYEEAKNKCCFSTSGFAIDLLKNGPYLKKNPHACVCDLDLTVKFH